MDNENKTISYEEIIDLTEDELTKALKGIMNKPQIKEIKKNCISNLLSNNNFFKNLKLLNKITKFFHGKRENQDNIQKIFYLFKSNIKMNLEKSEKNKQTKNDLDNNFNSSEQENNNISESLKQDYLKFFILFINIYDCERELIEFLIQNISILNLNTKKNFFDFINKIKKNNDESKIVNLINEILNNIEAKNRPFNKKEELELYEISLIELNYLKNQLEYTYKNNICRIRPKTHFNEHLDKYFSLFYIQDNEEVIKESIQFLFNVYYWNENIRLLFKKCKDSFNYSENMNIIKLYKYIIDNFEKEYVLKTHSHLSLCKKNIFNIKFKNEEEKEEKNLKFYGNTTVNEIYNFLIKNYESESEYFIINLVNEKEKKNMVLDKFYSNKTLNELKKKKIQINIIKKKIIPDELYEKENQKLTEKFENILKKWFRYFSKEKKEMNRKDLANFMNSLIKKDLFNEKSMNVIAFLKKNNNNKNFDFINQDNFVNYFYKIYKENNEQYKKYVLNNIKNMNLRRDLTEIPQEIDNNLLPRYYLSNKIENNSDLYIFDIFKEKYSKSLNEELFDFMTSLSTNEELYNNILNNFNKEEKMKFSQNFDNFFNNLYILMIIESIFEDVEILNNDKISLDQIYNRDNKSLSSQENNQNKKQFLIDFIKCNYSDMIDYGSKILEKMNKEENYDEKKHNIMIRTCSKIIELLNNIYNSLNEIKYDFQKESNIIINIDFGSFKKIFEENNLNTKINDGSLYEEIIIHIIIFIDKFYEKYDNEFNTKLSVLIKNCYILLFSLLYTNKNLFEYIYKNEENKNKLGNLIVNKIFLLENKKNIEYIRIFFAKFLKQKDKIVNNEFLEYLNELVFNILEKFISGEKNQNKNKSMLIIYLKNLLKRENINDKEKLRIIKFFEIFYNYIDSNFSEEKKINETINDIINAFISIFDSNESIKNEIIFQKFHNKMTLFDLCINQLFLVNNQKIEDKEEKFKNLVKILEQKENKFIPEKILIEKINEINLDNKNNNDAEKNIYKTINSYIDFCLNPKKPKNKNIIIHIISNLKKIKENEEKRINISNSKESSENNKVKTNFKNIKKKRIKKKHEFTGIRNIGSLCYLDSIIQQLYMIPQFKYSILDTDDKESPKESEFLKDDNLLHQLQKLFTSLSFTYYGEVIPKDFILSVKDYKGNPISPNQMQDSCEFFVNFSNLIEERLNNSKYKYLIQNLFIGKLCNKKICSSCNYASYNYEEFKFITLEVNKIKDIYDSLEKYISEDNIEDFNCPNCNQKVTLKKYTYLSKLPNILIIHLNRLIINPNNGEQQKINSKFEFPIELEVKKYCIEATTNEENENIYPKKSDYYKYNLRGVNIHKGNADSGHYISIIKTDKDKWYQFDDSRINEFNFDNLGEECFGGINEEKREGKKKSAYLLFYELNKKKPIKISLNKNEIELYKEKNKESIIEFDNNQIDKLEKKYDVSKLNNACDEKVLYDKVFINKEKNDYYKYISYDDIKKNVNKEYFLEVLKDNKIYDNIYGTKDININNSLIKILLRIIIEKDFNIKKLNFKYNEYLDLIDIVIELIISFVSDDNSRNNDNEIKNMAIIINKIFSPLINKEITFNNSDKDLIYNYIEENLFSMKYIKLIFIDHIKEIVNEIYNIFLALIDNNDKEKNSKLQGTLNKIINDEEKISNYLYKIFSKLIEKNNKNTDEINNVTYESFLYLYYKIYKEKNENLSEIIIIMKYLIYKKDILTKGKNELKEIKTNINDFLVKNMFDISINMLTILIRNFQFNDEKFSQEFNQNIIQKLYTYCSKCKDKKEVKEKQIKLMEFIFEILSINDKFISNRISLLLGYPTIIIKKNDKENIPLFGVSIMNNDINTQIFEYISYNHIKKERCALRFLFPSSQEKSLESCLEENDRNDLIYKLIKVMLGIDRKEGNYFLFKNIYLMQSRSIQHDNLYQEMKNILKMANEANNNKYDLSKISKAEKECISLVEYEQENVINRINLLTKEEKEKNILKSKPNLPEKFDSSKFILNEKENIEFIGNIIDIITYEIGKIKIELINKTKNLSLFRFEYFTTYFTKKDLKALSVQKREFVYDDKNLKKEKNEENEEKNNDDNIIDFQILTEKKSEKEFIAYLDEVLNDKKNGIILENKNILKDKLVKSTLIRYYILSKNKKMIKIQVIKDNMDKDIENNFFIPNIIHDIIEENQISNILNVHRLKNNYNFLKSDSIGIHINTSSAEKYIQNYFV